MNFVHAIIFGIVEGASEFLPISSTGHLMLTARLMGLSQTNFLKSFEIAIQLGAILSVILLYWKTFLINFETLKRVIVAFIPTAVIGFFLYKIIKRVLLANIQVVLWSLFIGGIILIVFEICVRGKEASVSDLSKMPYKTAIWIGIFQSLSVIPGVSRSAATIVGGLLLGLERNAVVEFSFLLAVPTMLAATGLDLFKNAGEFSADQFGFLLVGFIMSFVVATFCIKWLIHFVKNHSFIFFGLYRIFIAILFWFVIK